MLTDSLLRTTVVVVSRSSKIYSQMFLRSQVCIWMCGSKSALQWLTCMYRRRVLIPRTDHTKPHHVFFAVWAKQLFTNLQCICETHPNKDTVCPQVCMLHCLYGTQAAAKHFWFWPFFQIGIEGFDRASAVGPDWISPRQRMWCCLLGCWQWQVPFN